MGRPRTPIGTFGIIATRAQPNGNHVARARYRDWDGSNPGRPSAPMELSGTARCRMGNKSRARYRDWDGTIRQVQAAGPSRAAAELELKRRLAQRSLLRPGGTGQTPYSPLPALVDYWLEDMEIEDRLSRTTRLLYKRNMRTLVLPAFKDLTLREIGVARCDHFIKQLAKQSYNRARQARIRVLLFVWNTLKFLLIGPVSVVMLMRARIQETVARRRMRHAAEADRIAGGAMVSTN